MTRRSGRGRRRVVLRSARQRDESGASLVEFALILPLFIMILFALVDFGLVFGGFISVQNQVNSAARAVSINQLATGCSTSADPDLCTIEARISSAPLGVVANSVKVAIAFPNSGATAADNPVIVCAQATLKSTTGLTSTLVGSKTFYTASEIMLEQGAAVPAPSGPSYSFSNTSGFTCH